MTRAQRIVEELLEESVQLVPIGPAWNMGHIADQIEERLQQHIDPLAHDTHRKSLVEMFRIFDEHPDFVIMVGDLNWQMPMPVGWRLLGEGNVANSIIDPSQTHDAEWVDNPLLPKIYRSYWRDKMKREKEGY